MRSNPIEIEKQPFKLYNLLTIPLILAPGLLMFAVTAPIAYLLLNAFWSLFGIR